MNKAFAVATMLAFAALAALTAARLGSTNKGSAVSFLRGGRESRKLQKGKILTAQDFQFGGPLAPYVVILPQFPEVRTAKDFQFGGPFAPFVVKLPLPSERPKVLIAKDFQIGGRLAPFVIANPP